MKVVTKYLCLLIRHMEKIMKWMKDKLKMNSDTTEVLLVTRTKDTVCPGMGCTTLKEQVCRMGVLLNLGLWSEAQIFPVSWSSLSSVLADTAAMKPPCLCSSFPGYGRFL